MRFVSKSMLACLLLVICVLLSCGLVSCKYSDVLFDMIEDPDIGIIDERMTPIYREVQDSENQTDDDSLMPNESDRVDEQTQRLPVYDPNGPDAGVAKNYVHKQDDSHEEEATEPDQTDDQQDESGPAENQDEGEGETQTTTEGEGEGEGDQEGDSESESETPGEGEQGGESPSGGTGGEAQVYDDGSYEDLPEDVKCVAATGQYATIVQMLAGKGGLAAADEEWLATMKSNSAFPNENDEGISSVQVGWSGDGTDAGSIQVDAIIQSAPDCVLVGSGSRAITQEQQDQLMEAGISVVIMPGLDTSDTPDANVTQAVKVIAQLLRTAPTTYDAGKMADAYIDFHDETLSSCLSGNGGYAAKMVNGTAFGFIYQGTSNSGVATTSVSSSRIITAFIDSWTSAASSRMEAVRRYGSISMYLDGQTMDVSDGVGLSAKGATENFMLLDYYLQVAGVVNNAYDAAKPAHSEKALSYLVVPGSGEGLVSQTVTQRTMPSALWMTETGGSSADSWITVGDGDFPAIVVANADIAQKVQSSASRVNGLYNVGQPYQIFVIPTGIAGNWSKGTVESFLAAPWAYGMFQMGGDASVGSEYAASYYQMFYRCDSASAMTSYGETYDAPCPTS